MTIKKKREFNLVRCSKCKKVVGYDPSIKRIVACSDCHGETVKLKRIRTASSNFATVKKGPAKDLPKEYQNLHFRSSWERNFARVLCEQQIIWTYEERVFSFREVKRKPFVYIPDFYDKTNDIFWEVKGYLRSQDRSKMRRMKSQYPDEFGKLKACLSKQNKAAINFYSKIGIGMVFIEDLRTVYKDKVHWE